MYSLGCIIYELFTLNQYYFDKMINEIKEIESNDPKWQKIIDSLLDDDPNKRPNIDEVFKYLEWT